MILVLEMIWAGTAHSVANSAMIQTIANGFPEQQVCVLAEHSHLRELQSDPPLVRQPNVSFRTISISPHFLYRPQIVSFRRGLRELWTLLSVLRNVPGKEPCLIVLLSATPTAIFLASVLSKLMRRRIGVQVGLHGNLNDAFGWRSRNPLTRAIDLHAALIHRHRGRVRFLVLEDAIWRALAQRVPVAADATDVVPLPINPVDAEGAEPQPLSMPLRIGLVGQATEAKGITPFRQLASEFSQTLPHAMSFHLVGHPAAGADIKAFSVLREPTATWRLSRGEFNEKLRRLHYVCLPLEPAYYELSASGALVDAINWLKPIIATPVPMIVDLFARFGDIGVLCNDIDEMRSAIDTLARSPDQPRYDRQVANLRRLRAARSPLALAGNYRAITDGGFPGLLADTDRRPSHSRTATFSVPNG
jgi:hypothetical protein